MRTITTALIAGAFLATGLCGQNQPAAAGATYRVELVMHEANDAAAKAGRHYTLLIEAGGKGTLKVGNRVSVPTGQGSANFTYIDIGMNIDCRLREAAAGKMELIGSMDTSTLLPQKPGVSAPSSPVISQLRIDVDAALEPGKRATVASIQDPVTQRDLNVEATVTKIP